MYINRNNAHKSFQLYDNHAFKSKFAGNGSLKIGNGSNVAVGGLEEKASKNINRMTDKKNAFSKMNLEEDMKIKLRELNKLSSVEASSDKEVSSFFGFADQMYDFMERCVSVGLHRIQELCAESADRRENSSLELFESQGIAVQDPEVRDALSRDTYENRKKWVEDYIKQDLRKMLNFAARFIKGVYITTDKALGGSLSDVLNKFTPQIGEEERLGMNFSADQLVFFTSESLGIDGNVPATLEEQGTLLENVLHTIQARRSMLDKIHNKFKKETAQEDLEETEPFEVNTEELNREKYDYDAVMKMFDHLKMSQKLALIYGTIRFQENSFESLI